MGRSYEEERDNPQEPKPPAEPVEPNGFELSKKRKALNDTFRKMQGVADEITRLLQDEQRRQDKYRGAENAAGD